MANTGYVVLYVGYVIHYSLNVALFDVPCSVVITFESVSVVMFVLLHSVNSINEILNQPCN